MGNLEESHPQDWHKVLQQERQSPHHHHHHVQAQGQECVVYMQE